MPRQLRALRAQMKGINPEVVFLCETKAYENRIFELGAVDLGFTGNGFTWSRRWGKNSITERLDRGITNISWRLSFLKAIIHHLGAIKSDHCPILLDTNHANGYSPR